MKNRKKVLKYVAIFVLVFGMLPTVGSFGYAYSLYYKAAHDPKKPSVELVLRDPKMMSKIRFADGGVICEVGSERRVTTTLDKIAPIAKKAFLAIEDDKFYEHDGLNYKAIVRAGLSNIKNRGKKGGKQGASTVTQQTVKVSLLTSEKTLDRKVMEAVLSHELEAFMTKKFGSKKAGKDKIFEIYLNWINFDRNRYGIETASQTYFGKSAAELNLVESAALAAIPKDPTRYNPHRRPENNAKRRVLVLGRMKHLGWITAEEYKIAVATKLTTIAEKKSAGDFAQNICDLGKARLSAKYCQGLNLKSDRDKQICDAKISSLGTSVITTIDSKLQAAANQFMEAGRNAIGSRHKSKKLPEVAVVLIENKTGDIKAMATSSYRPGGLNYAFALRQPGSTMKPIVYAAAFNTGVISPQSVYLDEESHMDPSQPEKIWPSNYEPEFMGAINLRTALAHSVNTVAVKVIKDTGTARVISLSRELGITSELTKDLSLALGTSVISPLELAGAYSVFARGGEYISPNIFKVVGDQSLEPKRRHVYGTQVAGWVKDILRAVVEEGTGRRVNNKLPKPAYAKTGTTSNHTDALFAGFTDDYTTVVWVGHETQQRMAKETGASAALPIWLDVMHFAYKGKSAGAVYAMPTKVVDDTQVVEGDEYDAEGLEESSEADGSEEEIASPDRVKEILEGATFSDVDNTLLDQAPIELVPNKVEFLDDAIELNGGSLQLDSSPVQLNEAPIELR